MKGFCDISLKEWQWGKKKEWHWCVLFVEMSYPPFFYPAVWISDVIGGAPTAIWHQELKTSMRTGPTHKKVGSRVGERKQIIIFLLRYY